MTTIGIFGGGQLAQMVTQAAIGLGIETVIFERSADSPAGRLTQREIVGAWEDRALLARFAAYCDLVTLENEFVDAAILHELEAHDLPVYPTATTIGLVQDKYTQKRCIERAGLPLPAFRLAHNPAEVAAAADELGWPLVLKVRRNGYDGYGNATLERAADLPAAWERLGAGSPLLVEAFVPFERELAVMVVRGRDGTSLAYPVVETVQRNHICHVVRAPAAVPAAMAGAAQELAMAAVEAVNGIGVIGIELFALSDGRVLYNEMAPRPHNSGHYTIEGCVTSQFENHLRAVLGWPLGPTTMSAPAAVMINLLGSFDGPAPAAPARAALAIGGAHIHLYGKRAVRRGRKMGHVTALGATLEEAETIARRAADLIEL